MKNVITALLIGTATFLDLRGATPAPAQKQDTEIFADSFEYDSEARVAIYRGKVRVKDPQMDLTCATLTVKFAATNQTALPSNETNRNDRVESLLAEGGVVMTNHQDRTQAIGEKALYLSESDTIELTGSPEIKTPQGAMKADRIIWDRRNSKLRAVNPFTTIQGGGTNRGSLFMPGPARPKK